MKVEKEIQEISDEELVMGCVMNDRKSQEMLYRKFSREMYNICLAYENDRDKAKDILQEGFIKVFRSIKTFNKKGSLKGWIKRIMANTAIDHWRVSSNEDQFLSIDLLTPGDQPFESPNTTLNCSDILSQIGRLPSGARLIFNLYALEGYSHKEIAEKLHITEGTSKSQVNRARHLLQQYLGDNIQ
ncbi:RNA polymerase sigma factor [bacterium]|nr:RNA polymerase sigma factor [bacterium]